MIATHKKMPTYVEKATDVYLATDLIGMAFRDELDAAYILSADGDYTPAVELVTTLGGKDIRRVPETQPSDALGRVVTKFIPIRRGWLDDC